MVDARETLVSIVVLNWNDRAYIQDCIDCALNQSHENVEIIFVDNG